MTPEDVLARLWRGLKRAGMLRAATWTPQLGAPLQADVQFDAPGTLVLDDISTGEYAVTFRRADWPALQPNDRVTVDGGEYQVLQALPIDDGLLVRATLKRLN